MNDRVEFLNIFCTFIRCCSEFQTTHVQSSKRAPVRYLVLLFVLCYMRQYAFHCVKIVVPRWGYFGLLIDLVEGHTFPHRIATFP